MIRSIDESLSSLKVDYVDLLQLHALSSAEQVMNTEYREVLAEAKKSGKTRFIGVTTHSKEPDVNAVTDDPTKTVRLPCWSRTTSRNRRKSRPPLQAAAASIGIIAMKTQAGGYQGCIIVSARFNHKAATERQSYRREIFAR